MHSSEAGLRVGPASTKVTANASSTAWRRWCAERFLKTFQSARRVAPNPMCVAAAHQGHHSGW